MVLDAGNVFAFPGLQGKIKAETAFEGMQMMSYSLFNLGSKDFIHGLTFLLTTTDQFSLPTVNANVVFEDTGEPITLPYLVKNIGTLKVGFIGVVAKSFEDDIVTATADYARTIEVLEETTVLQREIDAIKNRVDLIVVLASVGLQKSIAIAQEIEGIDLIVCSSGEEKIEKYFVNGTYIVKAGYDGKYIGNVALDLNIMKNIVFADSTIVELDNSFSEDENLKALMDKYHTRLEEELKEELRDREQEDPDTGWYYVGSNVCMGCHPDQAMQWSTTHHAEAFDTLIESNQEYNPECIFCHTTGWGYTGGFIIPDETPEMENVQCEMCHGACGEHIETGGVDFESISENICLACHTSDNNPDFDYDIYYPAIEH